MPRYIPIKYKFVEKKIKRFSYEWWERIWIWFLHTSTMLSLNYFKNQIIAEYENIVFKLAKTKFFKKRFILSSIFIIRIFTVVNLQL